MSRTNEKQYYIGHRARLLKRVLQNLPYVEEYELLETLLTFAQPRKDVKRQAKDILKYAGSIRNMVRDPSLSYEHIKGVGSAISWYCSILSEIARRYVPSHLLCEEHDNAYHTDIISTYPVVTSFSEVQRFLATTDITSYDEQSCILHINAKKEIIAMENYNFDEKNKDFLQHVIARRSSAIILVKKIAQEHYVLRNYDVELLKKREQGLSLFGVTLLDYIICTPNTMVSLQQYSLLQFKDTKK